MPRMIPQTPDR